jgi:hypothetical protein
VDNRLTQTLAANVAYNMPRHEPIFVALARAVAALIRNHCESEQRPFVLA